jgi:hypothetical protein
VFGVALAHPIAITAIADKTSPPFACPRLLFEQSLSATLG